VTLHITRRSSHTDPNPLYCEIQLVHPDGTVSDWDIGYHDQKYVGYLRGE
jgi:hypothetical protein